MIKTYNQARIFLENLIKPIPYIKKGVHTEYDPLERMRTLLHLLDNPQHSFKSVQVSGTSGKGSTTYLLSHLLTAAGYKTGLTLSPHLMRITERFQINETPISDEYFISLVSELVPIVTQMKSMEVGEPTYFEALMALTFLYFAREKVDIAVVEVGLEGRYDGTNTLSPLLFVLTNISLDHIEYLGDTIEKIATEAVSAIKPGALVVTGVTQPTVKAILQKECEQKNARHIALAEQFGYTHLALTDSGIVIDYFLDDKKYTGLAVSLRGGYQAENITLAVTAMLSLNDFGFTITESHIRQSLQTASFAGRFDIRRVLVDGTMVDLILDGAHNPAKMEGLVHSLKEQYSGCTYTVIFACKQHKDIAEMSTYLATVAQSIVATTFSMTTDAAKNASMTVSSVEEQLKKNHPALIVYTADSIKEALVMAKNLSKVQKNKILVTGSLYLVGETLQLLNEQGQQH